MSEDGHDRGADERDREPPADAAGQARDAEAAQALQELERLVSRLQGAAEQLRSGDLSTDAAATLVEECAVLAGRAGSELDRLSRADRYAPAPGQDSLL